MTDCQDYKDDPEIMQLHLFDREAVRAKMRGTGTPELRDVPNEELIRRFEAATSEFRKLQKELVYRELPEAYPKGFPRPIPVIGTCS